MDQSKLTAYRESAAAAKARAKDELGEPQYSQRTIDLYEILRLATAVAELVAEVERLNAIIEHGQEFTSVFTRDA